MTESLTPAVNYRRSTERQQVELSARLTWKDASGAVRFASVMTRDLSDTGAFVVANGTAAIPLHRLVRVQLERNAREASGVPAPLREGRVLSAVWRVAPCRTSTGTPAGYALRFLVESREKATIAPIETRPLAVAS